MATKYKSIRIFENPILEKFTHVHPLTPLVLWTPIVAWLMMRSFTVHQLSVASFAVMGLAGFFSWTLAEYVLHRYIFHFHAESPLEKRLQFLIHGLHHADPVDPTRLVMPPFASIVLAVILFSLFRLVMGPRLVEVFFAFFVVGYLCYDYIHYYVHHFKPRTRLGKYLKQNHMVHHFVSQETHWGVSSPLWDHVFGTLAPKRETGRLKNAG